MKYTMLLLVLFFINNIYSQQTLPDNYILPLPEDLDSSEVNLSDLENAIERLHNFSEYIYNPVKITRLDSISYFPKNLTDAGNKNRWGTGSWGRGLFSKYVDRYLFNDLNKTDYNSFYKEQSNTKLKNYYWGTHPIISYCARTAQAYINLYYSSEEVITKSFCRDRFISGVKYLIDQQLKNGGYIQWHWRDGKNLPNINDDFGLNGSNSYSTADAVFTLKNVYEYVKKNYNENPNLVKELYLTIKKAGDYLFEYKDSSYHKNYISFSIWGLVHAYNVTKDEKYLNKAKEKYFKQIKDFQDENGAWYVENKSTLDYHDAHSPYMGIILRALIELYNALSNENHFTLRIELKKSIVKGINHFLITENVHENFSDESIRLAKDGGIFPYSGQTEYSKNKGRALQLTEALILALECENLFSTESDIERIKGFLNASLIYQIDETINPKKILHINSDIYFNSFTKYLRMVREDFIE